MKTVLLLLITLTISSFTVTAQFHGSDYGASDRVLGSGEMSGVLSIGAIVARSEFSDVNQDYDVVETADDWQDLGIIVALRLQLSKTFYTKLGFSSWKGKTMEFTEELQGRNAYRLPYVLLGTGVGGSNLGLYGGIGIGYGMSDLILYDVDPTPVGVYELGIALKFSDHIGLNFSVEGFADFTGNIIDGGSVAPEKRGSGYRILDLANYASVQLAYYF